jgi:hypothetical protein
MPHEQNKSAHHGIGVLEQAAYRLDSARRPTTMRRDQDQKAHPEMG